ncbi:MAG TPA: acyltransferase [Rhizomicrobium sp.]|nr:acyltransferase [Rhizomicrobium sp.]
MKTQRFAALDGLRGICALVVILYHSFRQMPVNPFAHGYLSVDVFFVLSGFVLAYAFGARLEAGMGATEFMRARIRRLGPIVWFSAGFSVLGCFATEVLGGPSVPSVAVLLAGAQNLFLLPMIGASRVDAFPLNGPIWSLFAEFWVNLAFALIAPRLTRSLLVAIILAGWTFVVLHAFSVGSADFGATQSTILYSIPRAIPAFACGVLIFNLLRSGALARIPSVDPLLVFTLWVMLSLVPTHGPVFDLVQIFVVAPIMITLLARSQKETPAWSLWLGRISYPLYATHAVVIYGGQRLSHGHLPLWALLALPALAILLADVLARWYEPVFRGTAGAPAMLPARAAP